MGLLARTATSIVNGLRFVGRRHDGLERFEGCVGITSRGLGAGNSAYFGLEMEAAVEANGLGLFMVEMALALMGDPIPKFQRGPLSPVGRFILWDCRNVVSISISWAIDMMRTKSTASCEQMRTQISSRSMLRNYPKYCWSDTPVTCEARVTNELPINGLFLSPQHRCRSSWDSCCHKIDGLLCLSHLIQCKA